MRFTFKYIEAEYGRLLDAGYQFTTCRDAFKQYQLFGSVNEGRKTIINRVDIDFSLAKASKLGEIFDRLKIPATFFVRLHAKEYNPFDFENFRHLKMLQRLGFEIGYHSEIVDQAAIWNEDAAKCLVRDLNVLSTILGSKVYGAASHGGITGLNNLDFWNFNRPNDFGLEYEAYQDGVMEASRYVSDSEWVRWKAYDKGERLAEDIRSPSEHVVEAPDLVYLLVHPDTYYERHIYE